MICLVCLDEFTYSSVRLDSSSQTAVERCSRVRQRESGHRLRPSASNRSALFLRQFAIFNASNETFYSEISIQIPHKQSSQSIDRYSKAPIVRTFCFSSPTFATDSSIGRQLLLIITGFALHILESLF